MAADNLFIHGGEKKTLHLGLSQREKSSCIRCRKLLGSLGAGSDGGEDSGSPARDSDAAVVKYGPNSVCVAFTRRCF